MASLLQSLPASAVRKQSTVISGYLQRAAHPIASSGTRSSMSPRCFPSRSISSQTTLRFQLALSHASSYPQQRRTFVVQLKRQSQTLKEKTSTVTPPPSAANLQLTNLPYFIRRTPSNQLPVYLVTKAGGTKQQTKIQKTEGDLDALRNDLARYLGLESGEPKSAKSSDITINRLNGHIIVKVRPFHFSTCSFELELTS
ncbi:mitochondrial 54S ribosomal protein mL49 [Aspergillus lucknowensis]|uniref:Large ribosomal subunit protein mL49 n=1 Tax=Aspergillus lucknowensis TaxID=176173 RepID=A0ABR4LMK3_9EURO